ncbi:MAG: dockerin type I domain-containing protein [Rubripirellula sp.]|nr:dockerin type I domain-containing protein [Rubripirellula sp.]
MFSSLRSRSTPGRRRNETKRRPRRLEALEARRLLATLIVDRLEDAVDLDPGDGVCEISGGGCTLRAAIQEANALQNVGGPDLIEIPPGIFPLTLAGTDEGQAATGDLDITQDVVLQGSGAEATIIDANAIDRVMDVSRGNVEIRNLTIRGGELIDDEISVEGSGGGIRNEGDLTLADSIVTGNVATVGAGVANYLGVLKVVQSTISGNGAASTVRGGGISNEANYDAASLQVTDSTITGNRADVGGGIHNYSYDGAANATLIRSTLSGNTADNGGAIANQAVYGYEPTVQATIIIRNSTVSGNAATQSGGGLLNQADPDSEALVVIDNSTITANAANTGGGLFQTDSDGTSMAITSSIVAGNQATNASDLSSGTAQASFTLLQDAEGHQISDGELGNIVGANPLLGPLQDNGGLTRTHLPESFSPVVDKGINSASLDFDQRGSAFRRTIDLPLNGNAADGTDIGAVEIGQTGAVNDFGDAPEGVLVGNTERNYPTTISQDGARHSTTQDGPYLGLSPPDTENEGQPTLGADGDDVRGADDEDAFDAPLILTPGETLADVTVRFHGGTAGGRLSGWIDFNLDGDWDDLGEQVLADVQIDAGPGSLPLSSVTIPANLTPGQTFVRLRVSSDSGLTPRGLANDGEVEDFVATIGPPLPDVADLSLTQTVNQENPSLAEQIEFTLTVRNDGPDRATGVEVGTFLPFELIFLRAITTQGSYDDFDEVWEVGRLASGTSAVLRIFVEVDTTDSISHSAEVIASDQLDPDSTPDNGIEAEDDQQTVSIGTCLTREPLPGRSTGFAYSCAAQPGSMVAFARGTSRGQTHFSQYGVTVDMAEAEIFAMAIADANGMAKVPELTGESDAGETFLTQAFELGPGAGKSNTVVFQAREPDLAASIIDLATFQTNRANPIDVNDDGRITSLDALIVINRLGSIAGSGEFQMDSPTGGHFYPDTNEDGRVTAHDALLVINRLAIDHQQWTHAKERKSDWAD